MGFSAAMLAVLLAGCDGGREAEPAPPPAPADAGAGAGAPGTDAGPMTMPPTARCATVGAECGTVQAKTRLDCGLCGAGQACGGADVPNRCDPGTCTPRTCTGLCGRLPDGCGNVLRCPDCIGGLTCGARGPNVCGFGACTPLTCGVSPGAPARCGQLADGCGGVVHCGACPSGQACRAGRCEAACPAGCPGGYRCERGACRGGDRNALVLRPTLVDITATITVGGAAPSPARCEGANPGDEKAKLSFELEDGTVVRTRTIRCETTNHVFTLSVPPGRYTPRVELPARGVQPLRQYLGAAFDAYQTSSITIDLPSPEATVPIRGTVVNWGKPVARWCGSASHRLRFRRGRNDPDVDVNPKCVDGTLSFTADLPVSTYDVELRLASTGGIALGPLTVDGSVNNVVLDTALTRVTGSLKAAAIKDGFVGLRRLVTPRDEVYLEVAPDWAAETYSIDLPAGRWVFSFPLSPSSDPDDFQPRPIVDVGGAAQVVDMPEPRFFTVNLTPDVDFCGDPPSIMQLYRLSRAGEVVGFARPSPDCTSGNARFSTQLPTGRYLAVALSNSWPRAWTAFDVVEPLDGSQTAVEVQLAMRQVAVSGRLRFRGGAETAACDFAPIGGISVRFESIDLASLARTTRVDCDKRNRAFSIQLSPATYRVVAKLGGRDVVALEALEVSANTGYVDLEIPLDLVPVAGSIDLSRLSSPPPCGTGDRLELDFIRQRSAAEGTGAAGTRADPASASRWKYTVRLDCPITDFTYQTFVPPGVYTIQAAAVRGGQRQIFLRRPHVEIR